MTVLLETDHNLQVLTEPSPPARSHPRRWPAVIGVAVICGVALAARLHEIGSQSMWLDEAVSSSFADQGLVALWSWTKPLDAYHPPGYYSLLALWQLGGHSEVWLRSFSALAGVVAIPFAFGATRRISNTGAAYVAALLLALAPLQVRFGQETRTYSLMVLEAAVVLWSLTWILRYQRISASRLRHNPAAPRWYALVAALSMALLSHNTGALMWISANVAVLVHWRLTPHRSAAFLWSWTRANLAIGAIWLVWFPVFIRQSLQTLAGGTHRTVPGVKELLLAFRDLSLGQSMLEPRWMLAGDLLAVAALVGTVVIVRRRPRARRFGLTLTLFAVTAPTVAYVASVLGKPVFLTQSLMWTSVPFFMLVGIAVTQLPRLLSWPVAAVVLTVTTLGLLAYYPSARKEPWRDAAAYLGPRLGAGDLVVYSADYAMVPMQYYLRSPAGVTQIGTKYLPEDLATVRREIPDAPEVWLVYAHEEFADPNHWVKKVLGERGEPVEQRTWGEEIEIVRFLPKPPPVTGGP